MKKMMTLSAIVLLLLTGTSAFAETSAATRMAGGFSNGITYFEMGQNARCDSAPAVVTVPQGNGITYFNLGMPGSGANAACASDNSGKSSKKWLANGITIFS
ncbi:MAG TPA: hypothetical protein VK654_06610 [Nitrospirota bacterium]|nr:hypothetical protein [Nitrospirota bacterium]